jgi:hypothetical protein
MIFHEVYEVVGPDKKRAEIFAKNRDTAHFAQWQLVDRYGAAGFRPGPMGTIKSLIFDQKQSTSGFRYVGRDGKRFEYSPHRGNTAGKKLAAELSAAPRVETWGEFANTFNWKGRSPIDGAAGKIYHCTGVHVAKPRSRFFMKYPRELKDKWKAPSGLRLIRESTMIRAIEDHNATIKN